MLLQKRGPILLQTDTHGGATVVFTVAKSNEVRPSELPEGDFRAAVAFYPGWCSRGSLGTRWTPVVPFLLEIGAADDWTPAPPCVAIVRSAIERGALARLRVYDHAYHDFDWPGRPVQLLFPTTNFMVHVGVNAEARADALERVPAFLDEYLKR